MLLQSRTFTKMLQIIFCNRSDRTSSHTMLQLCDKDPTISGKRLLLFTLLSKSCTNPCPWKPVTYSFFIMTPEVLENLAGFYQVSSVSPVTSQTAAPASTAGNLTEDKIRTLLFHNTAFWCNILCCDSWPINDAGPLEPLFLQIPDENLTKYVK